MQTQRTPDHALRIFVSSAPADRESKDALLRHLSVLTVFDEVCLWSSDDILPGDDAANAVDAALHRANLALLLISPDFLASSAQLPSIFDRHMARGLRVIPILIRTCAWQFNRWLRRLHPLPKNGRAIAAHDGDSRDEVLAQIVAEVASVAQASRPPSLNAGTPTSSIGSFIHSPKPARTHPLSLTDYKYIDHERLNSYVEQIGVATHPSAHQRVLHLLKHLAGSLYSVPSIQQFTLATLSARRIIFPPVLKEQAGTLAVWTGTQEGCAARIYLVERFRDPYRDNDEISKTSVFDLLRNTLRGENTSPYREEPAGLDTVQHEAADHDEWPTDGDSEDIALELAKMHSAHVGPLRQIDCLFRVYALDLDRHLKSINSFIGAPVVICDHPSGLFSDAIFASDMDTSELKDP